MVNSQKNPLFPVALAFAAGITLSAFIASPGFWGLIVLVAGSVGMFLLTSKRIVPRLQQVSQASLYCCFALAGWVLGENAALIPQNDPMHFIGQEMEVQGHVVDDVRTTAFGHKTILEITQPMQGKVMLYLPLTAKAPQPNDALQGTIQLQALSQKNLGYANWLHHQGIHATAKAASLQKVGEKSGLMAMLHSLRSRVAAQFSATFPNATTAGLSNAMLLGDRTSLDGDIRKDFSATGLSHIVAISGMNFAIIYGVLNLLLYPMLYLRRGRQMRSLIVVPLLAFFALLTGGNPAVVRAAIMLGMLDLSQAFWSKNNSLNALATSALLFLAFDPQSLFTPDFQLSYAAVLGILLLQNPILHYIHLRLPKFPKLIGSALAVTLAAQAATTPLVAWHFHSFPTYFLLANLIVLPLVTLVVQIGFAGFVLAWIPGINTVWGGVMDFLLWAITGMANFMAELPGATISALEPGQTGIWILLAQVLLAFGILERRFLTKAVAHLRGQSAASRVAVAGLQRRVTVVGLVIGWVMVGFVLG